MASSGGAKLGFVRGRRGAVSWMWNMLVALGRHEFQPSREFARSGSHFRDGDVEGPHAIRRIGSGPSNLEPEACASLQPPVGDDVPVGRSSGRPKAPLLTWSACDSEPPTPEADTASLEDGTSARAPGCGVRCSAARRVQDIAPAPLVDGHVQHFEATRPGDGGRGVVVGRASWGWGG